MKPLFDRKLDKDTMKHYIFQSLLAGISLFLALQLPFIEDFVLIAAIGSTSFIVFAMPESNPAKPKNVLGGHLACGLLGLLFFNLHSTLLPLTAPYLSASIITPSS